MPGDLFTGVVRLRHFFSAALLFFLVRPFHVLPGPAEVVAGNHASMWVCCEKVTLSCHALSLTLFFLDMGGRPCPTVAAEQCSFEDQQSKSVYDQWREYSARSCNFLEHRGSRGLKSSKLHDHFLASMALRKRTNCHKLMAKTTLWIQRVAGEVDHRTDWAQHTGRFTPPGVPTA